MVSAVHIESNASRYSCDLSDYRLSHMLSFTLIFTCGYTLAKFCWKCLNIASNCYQVVINYVDLLRIANIAFCMQSTILIDAQSGECISTTAI